MQGAIDEQLLVHKDKDISRFAKEMADEGEDEIIFIEEADIEDLDDIEYVDDIEAIDE